MSRVHENLRTRLADWLVVVVDLELWSSGSVLSELCKKILLLVCEMVLVEND